MIGTSYQHRHIAGWCSECREPVWYNEDSEKWEFRCDCQELVDEIKEEN